MNSNVGPTIKASKVMRGDKKNHHKLNTNLNGQHEK